MNMRIAVSFKLLNINGTHVTYGYSKEFNIFEGVFEIDLSKHIGLEFGSENEQDITFELVSHVMVNGKIMD
ncbi:hypothetical protein [Paenibacillus sp. N3.4]|uniref:hypothetical protein n=1 Tax=Paenibacillus sp. N3.4 TaxID=2603222 RepID=UPI0011CCA389|nr:hypothetical protein [Paenibacillus sp. N3.4]TXK85756.1 hypothetical protein FU659_02290 [Paenibacillus sp. N3.4]